MADSAADSASDYNTKIIEEFRANEGRVGGEWAGFPLILVHHIGAKSGIERVQPLGCFILGDGRFAIVASNGGSPTHPHWYYNLKANPRVTAEVGGETFTVMAEELDDAARDDLWPTLVASASSLDGYQAKTEREIPVFLLIRVD